MSTDTIQTTQNRKVQKRLFLTAQEVSLLLDAAKKTRYPTRDRALILITFRHGLRASEAIELKWSQINLKSARIEVNRRKGSDNSVQVLEHDEVQVLAKLRKESPDSEFVFLSERDQKPMKDGNFLQLMKRLGKKAGLPFNVHPHMLRHGAGYELVNANASTRKIQAFLGHKNLIHTERYTKFNATAFKDFGSMIGGRIR